MKVDIVTLKIAKEYEFSISGDNEYIYGIETAEVLFCSFIGSCNIEHVALLCLDRTNKIINLSKIAIGNVENVFVSPAQILKIALLSNASKIMVAHNHPSGVLKVTSNDINATKRIGALAAQFDIELIDSLVVNEHKSLSIREELGKQ